MITMDSVLMALHVASVAELIYNRLMLVIILTLPFLLGVLYGSGSAQAEERKAELDERAIALELRRRHDDYVRDMLRQIDGLE